MFVETSWRVFPWILDIDANVVKALNFYAPDSELEVTLRNFHHVRGWRSWRPGGRNGHDLLRQHLPLMRIARQGARTEVLHLGHERLDASLGCRGQCHQCGVAVRFDRKTQDAATRLILYGCEFPAMVQIVIVHACSAG